MVKFCIVYDSKGKIEMIEMYMLNFLVDRAVAFNKPSMYYRGANLTDVMREKNIPQATFYRHIKNMIDQKIIIRVGSGYYKLDKDFVSRVVELSV